MLTICFLLYSSTHACHPGGGVRHLTMRGGKLLLSQSLSRKKEDHGDKQPKRKEMSMPLSTLPSPHPAAGHFSSSEENEGEDHHLDSGDYDTTLAEEQHNKPPPPPSGPENDLDDREFVFTAPKVRLNLLRHLTS